MRVGFPTSGASGMNEGIHGHFGRAPFFTIVDTEDGSVKSVPNAHADHEHGHGQGHMCSPIEALAHERVDAVAVQGIGPGAIAALGSMGIVAYHAPGASVAEALEALKAGRLAPMGHGGGCDCHH